MSTVPKIPKDKIAVCIVSFVSADGTIHEGDRLRASDPAVQRWPQFFIEDGATTDEIHSARQARFMTVP